MALKQYAWRNLTWQFEESEAPEDAVLIEEKAAPKAANKAAKAPANKGVRSPRAKKAE